MKKWTQQLLTSYPLIWNTRIYLMLPVLAILYLFSFLLGYLKNYTLTTMYQSDIEPDGGMVMFVVLMGLLLLIGWLIYYFRNNALKSLYPTDTGKLFGEYLIILLISVGLVSIIEPYRMASYFKFQHTFRHVDVVKEANTINLAHSFLAFDFNKFHNEGNGKTGEPSPADRTTTLMDVDTIPDSLVADFSYLNYYDQMVELSNKEKGLLTTMQLHTIATRWLREGKQDSVTYALNEYLKLVSRYGSAHHLNVDRLVKEIFSTPDFRVKRKLYTSDQSETQQNEFIEIYASQSFLAQLSSIRHRAPFQSEDMIFLYLGLGCATVILSFRLTKMRTWFIALVGSCIWAILLGLLGIMLHSAEGTFLVIYLLLCLGFIAFAAMKINARSSKEEAGVSFIWFQWVLPSLLPLLLGMIKTFLNFDRYSSTNNYTVPEHPFAVWIDDNWMLIMLANVGFVIAITGWVILPMAKRWQAMPAE